MNIEQAQIIFNRQMTFGRTPFGRSIKEKGLQAIEATLQDADNYGNDVVQCQRCGFVVSMLLTESGCPNCEFEKFTTQING